MIGLLLLPLVSGWNYLFNGVDWTGVCNTGKSQSPINIARASPSVFTSYNSGYSLNLAFQDVNSSLSLSYGSYKFVNSFGRIAYQAWNKPLVTGIIQNIHFHSPAENFLDGIQHDLEMHIVMEDEAGKYSHVVLGVWFQIGDTEDDLVKQAILGNNQTVTLNLNATFTGTQIYEFITFNGSLTTPPCTEDALWFLDPNIRTITKEQYAFFYDMWEGNSSFANGDGNFRTLEGLNGRTVTYYTTLSEAGWLISGLLALIYA